MDQTQEQMKFIGIFGIFSQSFKTILKWNNIFTKITLTSILPLTIIFIAHMEISRRFFTNIEHNPFQLFTDAADCYRIFITSEATPIEWLCYLVFKTFTITTVTAFSLISTAAVVYTVTSIYTACDVTYRKSLKVVPKIWKRPTVTFLNMFLMFFIYHLIVAVVFFLWQSVLYGTVAYVISLFPFFFVYMIGFVYLSIVWQLAIVVSVLETSYGLKSMIKALDLIKGKKIIAIVVSFLLYLLFVGVVFVYLWSIVFDNWPELQVVWKVVIGIVCLVLLMVTFLLFIVIQTVLYLVCKSLHREPIIKPSLTTYLGAYLSDSQPAFIASEDIQLGRPQNQPAN